MTVQTYVCLQPVLDGFGFHDRGQVIHLDDALAATQTMVSAKTIELQSSPSEPADLTSTQGRNTYIQQQGMTPEGGPFPGADDTQNPGPFGDVGPPDVGGGPGPGESSS